MKIYLLLFFEFFKIGLFSVGGGYATMPFLYHIVNDYGWYSAKQLSDMIAVSVITPGPVGVNVATFAGFQTAGISGGIFATLALVLPSYIMVIKISEMMTKYKDNFWTNAILDSLKPAGCGLLTVVGINFFKEYVQNVYALLLFIFLFLLSFKFKKNPIYYFVIAGLIGILLQYFTDIDFIS